MIWWKEWITRGLLYMLSRKDLDSDGESYLFPFPHFSFFFCEFLSLFLSVWVRVTFLLFHIFIHSFAALGTFLFLGNFLLYLVCPAIVSRIRSLRWKILLVAQGGFFDSSASTNRGLEHEAEFYRFFSPVVFVFGLFVSLSLLWDATRKGPVLYGNSFCVVIYLCCDPWQGPATLPVYLGIKLSLSLFSLYVRGRAGGDLAFSARTGDVTRVASAQVSLCGWVDRAWNKFGAGTTDRWSPFRISTFPFSLADSLMCRVKVGHIHSKRVNGPYWGQFASASRSASVKVRSAVC